MSCLSAAGCVPYIIHSPLQVDTVSPDSRQNDALRGPPECTRRLRLTMVYHQLAYGHRRRLRPGQGNHRVAAPHVPRLVVAHGAIRGPPPDRRVQPHRVRRAARRPHDVAAEPGAGRLDRRGRPGVRASSAMHSPCTRLGVRVIRDDVCTALRGDVSLPLELSFVCLSVCRGLHFDLRKVD